MSNLYNLIQNFDFYLEAFRNIETNKTFVSQSGYKEDLSVFFSFLKIIREEFSEEKRTNILNKIEESYDSIVDIFERLKDDEVFHGEKNAFFSIDLEQENIEEFKKLYNEMIEKPKQNINALINFIDNTIKEKLFSVTIELNMVENGINIYDIIFSNFKFNTNSTENNNQKGLISKNYKIIFGVILGFAEKLNIDFDETIFHFSGTTEGEKDNDKNRRLIAYHMAHRGFLKMRYDDIDEKELKNAFDNKEVHPFLYRPDKDEMYISVSKDVNLKEILDDDEGNINDNSREEVWPEFVEDYLQSDEGLEEIKEIFINSLDRDVKEFIEILFSSEEIWNDLVVDISGTLGDINDKINQLLNITKKAVNREISFKDFSDNNEELVSKVEENYKQEMLDLTEGYASNIPEIFSLLKDIVEKYMHNVDKNLIINIIDDTFQEAIENAETNFREQNYRLFIDGMFDDWIWERIA